MKDTAVAVQELPPVPPRPVVPEGINLRQRMMLSYKYFEENKDAIIKEWEESGRPKALKRWGIPSTALYGLLERWKLKEKPAKKHKGHAVEAVHPPAAEKPSTAVENRRRTKPSR